MHQSRFAARCINLNIARHFHRAEKLNYDPRSRERRLEVESCSSIETRGEGWTPVEGGTALSGEGGSIRVGLVENLPNGPHTLELVGAGGGPVTVDAFDVFEPPLE